MTQPRPRRSGGKWYARFRVPVPAIPSAEAFGAPAIATGPLGLRPTGIASVEAFGTPWVTYPQTVQPSAISSAEAFGTAAIEHSLNLAGVPSAEAFGIATMQLGPVALSPAGIESAEVFGACRIATIVAPGGISSGEVVGQPNVIRGIGAAGIASAETFGTQAVTRGPVSVAVSGIPSAEAFGTAVVTQPATVVYDAVGVGTETTATPTQCTINPAAGSDVLAFYSVGGGGVSGMTYGASNLPMTCVGQALSSGVVIAAYLIRGVSAGSATININKVGNNWGQAVAVSYTGTQGYGPAKQVVGNGASFSQSAAVPLNGRVIHAFTPGESSTTLSGLAGGTSRYLDNAGFLTQSVRDTDVNATFAGTLSATRNWAALASPLRAVALTGPTFRYSSGTASEGNNDTRTFDVVAAVGDYIYSVVGQDRSGNPSSVTCAGTAMTLIDTQAWTSASGTGYIKVYRSAAAMASAGTKTISITATGGGWWRAAGLAVSGVTNPSGIVTKTAGTSSQPAQSVTCLANQLILQAFVTATAPTGTEGGAALFLSPSAGLFFLVLNVADESTTFKLANTSINWGAMALVLS